MQLVYFASVREQIGVPEETFKKPDTVTTVEELIHHLQSLGNGYAEALAKPDFIRVAVNQTHVQHQHPITDTDEVALFPPVTGG